MEVKNFRCDLTIQMLFAAAVFQFESGACAVCVYRAVVCREQDDISDASRVVRRSFCWTQCDVQHRGPEYKLLLLSAHRLEPLILMLMCSSASLHSLYRFSCNQPKHARTSSAVCAKCIKRTTRDGTAWSWKFDMVYILPLKFIRVQMRTLHEQHFWIMDLFKQERHQGLCL